MQFALHIPAVKVIAVSGGGGEGHIVTLLVFAASGDAAAAWVRTFTRTLLSWVVVVCFLVVVSFFVVVSVGFSVVASAGFSVV